MSLLVVDRVMARRLPLRDQANDPMKRLSVKRVSWRCTPQKFFHDLTRRAGCCAEFRTSCGSGLEAEYHRPFGDASHRPHSAR